MSNPEVQNLYDEAVLYALSEQPSVEISKKRLSDAVHLDKNQCDTWRALVWMDPTSPESVRLLSFVVRTLDTFGQLSKPASVKYQMKPVPGDDNPISTMLSATWPLPLDNGMELSSPTRIKAAWAVHLAVDEGRHQEAAALLESVTAPQSPAVHLAWALVYWHSQRWADAKTSAEKLFRAPALQPDEMTIRTDAAGNQLFDTRAVAAGYLIAGMAHAHLSEDELAKRWLGHVLGDQLESYPVMRRAAHHTLALLHRARGAFAEADQSFASARIYGTTNELEADANDTARRMVFTSAETIAQRTSYWDPATEPSLEKINERRHAEETSEVLAEALARLDKQIALWDVKAKVHEFAANEQMNEFLRSQGEEPEDSSRYNFVFYGPPGAGKTVTARSIMELMYGYKIIRERKLIEVSAADLVGSAVGQAEELTLAALRSADGGLILIDEVYQLTQKGDDAGGSNANVFGKKAAETILKYMEDNPTDCHVVIAGYKHETDRFIASNPGFKSRFTDYIEFVSYTPDELGQIAKLMASERKPALSFTDEAHARFVQRCQILTHDAPSGDGKLGDIAGNGRLVRNFIDAARRKLNVRLQPLLAAGTQMTIADATTLTVVDVDAALDPLLANLY